MKYLSQYKNYLSEELGDPVFPFSRLDAYPTGPEIDKATLGTGGIPFFKIIFYDPELGPMIKDIQKFGKFCKSQKDRTQCVKEMREKQDAIAKLMKKKGILLNHDVSDCFWENIEALEEDRQGK